MPSSENFSRSEKRGESPDAPVGAGALDGAASGARRLRCDRVSALAFSARSRLLFSRCARSQEAALRDAIGCREDRCEGERAGVVRNHTEQQPAFPRALDGTRREPRCARNANLFAVILSA